MFSINENDFKQYPKIFHVIIGSVVGPSPINKIGKNVYSFTQQLFSILNEIQWVDQSTS